MKAASPASDSRIVTKGLTPVDKAHLTRHLSRRGTNLKHLEPEDDLTYAVQQNAYCMGIIGLKEDDPSLLQQIDCIARRDPFFPILVIAGTEQTHQAEACLKQGAHDYLLRPLCKKRLSTISNLLERWSSRHAAQSAFRDIVTRNEQMLALFSYARTVAKSPAPVLITGETGTGKELLAKAIHELSNATGEYITVNVAGVDDQLFSDTLFGHLKGAFTGAIETRRGAALQADDGNLLLDEIGDLPEASQMKLLRFIQERRVTPIGSDRSYPCSTRLIAATNRQLDQLTADGKFREDLFYRLYTHHLHLPPLRERQDDLPLLIRHFVKHSANLLELPIPTISDSALNCLLDYDYPGNIRQLEATLLDAVSRSGGAPIKVEHLNRHLCCPMSSPGTASNQPSSHIIFPSKLPSLADTAKQLILEAMQRCDENQTEAAKILQISQPALSRRLKKLR